MNDITDLQPRSTPLTYFKSDEYKNKFSSHIAVSSVLQGECQDGSFKETMQLFLHIFPSFHHRYTSFDVEYLLHIVQHRKWLQLTVYIYSFMTYRHKLTHYDIETGLFAIATVGCENK